MIFINGQRVIIEKFPNGECLIKTDQFSEAKSHYQVELRFEDNSDLFNLYLIKKHLDHEGKSSRLIISYMPYSRMDRTQNRFVFTLKYICEFINNLNFYSVAITEPHSDVTSALIDRCKVNVILPRLVLKAYEKFNPVDALLFPDYGACKRYSSLFKDDCRDKMWGNKTRDFSTGKITHMEIMDIPGNKPKKVIVIDDLCSYGGTFILAGYELKKIGVEHIYLCVAHCEKSITKGDILKTDIIEHVITTNSIIQPEDLTEEEKTKVTFYKGDY